MTTLRLKWRNLRDEYDFGSQTITLPATIGRSRQNAVRLRRPGAGISRQHVQITVDECGLRVRDLQSTNGVYVHGHQVREGYIPSGGMFIIGEYEFTLAPSVRCANAQCAKQVDTSLVICPWCGRFLADAHTDVDYSYIPEIKH